MLREMGEEEEEEEEKARPTSRSCRSYYVVRACARVCLSSTCRVRASNFEEIQKNVLNNTTVKKFVRVLMYQYI